mmetsp:Transcript_20073/g.24735  ORF Transcript_20073/g.24735 Transcript_20073/m.24735 type:complete len:287 (-) Transcript_20073:2081-2941(-)
MKKMVWRYSRRIMMTSVFFLLFLETHAFVTQNLPRIHCRKMTFSSSLSSSLSLFNMNQNEDIDKASKELESILRNKFKINEAMNDSDKTKIDNLIDILIQSKSKFDPSNCINGHLFAVLYQSGPIPFWEKYDFKFFKRNNIKGQRYTTISTNNNDYQKKGGGELCFDLVNYAEFWGQELSIQGCGICSPLEEASGPISFLPLSASKMLTCPVDYKVTIQNANIQFLNTKLNLNVEGVGYTRILYANPNMRIVLAPKDTSDERWLEKAGLMVVQVRVDLLKSDFVFP